MTADDQPSRLERRRARAAAFLAEGTGPYDPHKRDEDTTPEQEASWHVPDAPGPETNANPLHQALLWDRGPEEAEPGGDIYAGTDQTEGHDN